MKTVALLLFDEAEVLDFAAPFDFFRIMEGKITPR